MSPVPLVALRTCDRALSDCGVSPASFAPPELLHLAILGSAARQGVELEDLLANVRSMSGAFWQPTEDVVLSGLQQLITEDCLRIDPAARPRHVVWVRATERGRLKFAALMDRDVRHTPEPLFHAVMMSKIALVDVLPLAQRGRQVSSLLERLARDLQTLRRDAASSWNYARLFDEDRLEGEIRWLRALVEMAGSLRTLPPAEELAGAGAAP